MRKALITKSKPLLTDSEYKSLNTSKIKEQYKERITISETKDLKLGPIVGGPKCPTSRLSNLLDLILKPLTKHFENNIKDNYRILRNM